MPAQPHDSAPPAAIRAVRIVLVLALAAYAAYTTVIPHGPAVDRLFEDWVFNGLIVGGSVLCLLRAALSRRERGAWAVLGAGLACWAAGTVLLTIDPGAVTDRPFPTLSDVLWLLYYPAGFLALGLLVRGRTRQFFASLWLDGVVGALAVAAVAAQFVLPPIVAGTGGSLGTVVGDLVYPLGDLLLVAFVVAVLAVTGWQPGRLVGTVSAGFVIGAVADGLSLYWSATGHQGPAVFDVLWPACAVVLGWAAWQPARPAPVVSLEGRRLLVMPLGFAGVAVWLLVLQAAEPLHGDAYLLAVATVVGVVARMGLTFSENLTLVDRSRRDALTDPLTGLGNRRRLLLDLDDAVRSAADHRPRALLLFDLNGFKGYNDTFGHPAGDALLARLGGRLAQAVAGHGSAYRLGGDEFCVLADLDSTSLELLTRATVPALSEDGAGFSITTACGSILLPAEAADAAAALQLADRRLYADKGTGRRAAATRLTREELLALLDDHDTDRRVAA